MRLRKWIGLVAMLSVLVHAGALVRHQSAMLGSILQFQALISDLAVFCHGGADSGTRELADLPAIPKPSDAQNGCPICSGQSTAFAVVVPEFIEAPDRLSTAIPWFESTSPKPAHRHAVCPPARGPPTTTELA